MVDGCDRVQNGHSSVGEGKKEAAFTEKVVMDK